MARPLARPRRRPRRRRPARITAAAARVVSRTGLVTSDPKTEASSTQIPLADAAVSLLHLQHQHQQAEREAAHVWRDTGHVFTTTIGTPPRTLRRQPRMAAPRRRRRRRLPHPRRQGRGLHELRRSFTTLLRALGAPLEDVQALGRWASPQVLLGHYTATTVDRLRDVANAAADQLGLGTISEPDS